jgi:transposase
VFSFSFVLPRFHGNTEIMFVMEASGGYESVFCAQLGKHAIAYAVVNARRVLEFARCVGIDAKTGVTGKRFIMGGRIIPSEVVSPQSLRPFHPAL